MTLVQAIVLAALQGLTEFLPVSSSGHLVLAAELGGLPLGDAAREAFFVLLHGASLLAVVAFLGPDVWRLLRGPDRYRVIWAVGLGCIPAGLAGLLLTISGSMGLFATPWIVGVAWIATALLLWSTRRAPTARWGPFEPGFGRGAGVLLLIGLAQAVALVPGISRSGSTIAVALLLAMRREEAFRYSFLMAVPLIAMAQIVEWKALGPLAEAASSTTLCIAFGLCFVVSLVSLWVLAKIVRGGRLAWFAPYCLLAGVATLILWGAGTLR